MVAAPELVTGDLRTLSSPGGPPSAPRAALWMRAGSRSKRAAMLSTQGARPSRHGGRDHGQLLEDALVAAGDPGADPERVGQRQREQGEVGDEHPPPGGGQHRQQRAEDRQVRQRVQQVDQERLRSLAQMVELRPEREHPADDEQGDRHHVAVGEAGQHAAGIASPLALGQHHHPDRGGREREQRRHVGQREGQPGRAELTGEHLRHDQPGEPEQGGAAEPAVPAGDRARVARRTRPQGDDRPGRGEHGEDVHRRSPVFLRCNRGSFRASRSVAGAHWIACGSQDGALLRIRQRIGNDPSPAANNTPPSTCNAHSTYARSRFG